MANLLQLSGIELARRIRVGEVDLPPLLGLPRTIKEGIALGGMPNQFGVSGAEIIASEDAIVARQRAAGAIPLGVTNPSVLG